MGDENSSKTEGGAKNLRVPPESARCPASSKKLWAETLDLSKVRPGGKRTSIFFGATSRLGTMRPLEDPFIT